MGIINVYLSFGLSTQLRVQRLLSLLFILLLLEGVCKVAEDDHREDEYHA